MSFRIHLSVTALLIASWAPLLPVNCPLESDNKEGYQAYKEALSRSRELFCRRTGRAEQFDNGDSRLITALNNLPDLRRNRVSTQEPSRCTYAAINSEKSLERRTQNWPPC